MPVWYSTSKPSDGRGHAISSGVTEELYRRDGGPNPRTRQKLLVYVSSSSKMVPSSWRERLQTLQVKRPSMPSSYIVIKNFTVSSRPVAGNIEIISSKTFLSACAVLFRFPFHTLEDKCFPPSDLCYVCITRNGLYAGIPDCLSVSCITGHRSPVKQYTGVNVSLVDLARRAVNGRGEFDWKNDEQHACGRCATLGNLLPVCEVLRTSIIFMTMSVMAAAISGTFV